MARDSAKVEILFSAKGIQDIIAEIDSLQSKLKGIDENFIGQGVRAKLESVSTELQQIRTLAETAFSGMGSQIDTSKFDKLTADVGIISSEITKLSESFRMLSESGSFAQNLSAGFKELDSILAPIEAKMKAITNTLKPVNKAIVDPADKYRQRVSTLQNAQKVIGADVQELDTKSTSQSSKAIAKDLESATAEANTLYEALVKVSDQLAVEPPNSSKRATMIQDQIAQVEKLTTVIEQMQTKYNQFYDTHRFSSKTTPEELQYSRMLSNAESYFNLGEGAVGEKNQYLQSIVGSRLQSSSNSLKREVAKQAQAAKAVRERASKEISTFQVKNGSIEIPMHIGIAAAQEELTAALGTLQTEAQGKPIQVPITVKPVMTATEGATAAEGEAAVQAESTVVKQLEAEMTALGQAVKGIPTNIDFSKLDLSNLKFTKPQINNVLDLAAALEIVRDVVNQLNVDKIQPLTHMMNSLKMNPEMVDYVKALKQLNKVTNGGKKSLTPTSTTTLTTGTTTSETTQYKAAQRAYSGLVSKVEILPESDVARVKTSLDAVQAALQKISATKPADQQKASFEAFDAAVDKTKADLQQVATLQKELGVNQINKLNNNALGFNLDQKLDSFVPELDKYKAKITEINNLRSRAFQLDPKADNFKAEKESIVSQMNLLKTEAQKMFRNLSSTKWNKEGVWKQFIPKDAKQLQQIINEDVKANRGTITNWGDANANVQKVTYQYKDLEGNINKVTLAADKMTGAIKKSVTPIPQMNSMEKTLSTIGSKIKQVSAYWIAFYANPMMAINYFKNIIGYVKELDSALTELRVVSNASDGELASISKQSYEVAQAVGSTTTDIVKSVTEWRRLGESVSDSMTLAEQASRLSTGGLMSTDVATEALTSAMKAYGYEVKDVYKIVDQFIYLGNNYAISSEQLATSLEKSSGALVAAGNTLEEAEAMEIAGKLCCPNVQKCA